MVKPTKRYLNRHFGRKTTKQLRSYRAVLFGVQRLPVTLRRFVHLQERKVRCYIGRFTGRRPHSQPILVGVSGVATHEAHIVCGGRRAVGRRLLFHVHAALVAVSAAGLLRHRTAGAAGAADTKLKTENGLRIYGQSSGGRTSVSSS